MEPKTVLAARTKEVEAASMPEKDRVRKRNFRVWLLEEEFDLLTEKAAEAKMTKTRYIRNVILFGAAREKSNFTKEDSDKILYELNRIGNNINQIAYQANSKCAVNENDFFMLREEYIKLLGAYEMIATG